MKKVMIFIMANPDAKAFSVRTYKPNKFEARSPFFCNIKLPDFQKISQDELKGYHIILTESVPPKESILAARLLWNKVATVEYLVGGYTVRDMEYMPDKVISCSPQELYKEYHKYHPQLLNELDRLMNLFIHEDSRGIIAEFSIYPHKIGWKKENLIFWEVRKI